MKNSSYNDLEKLWDHLLSRKPKLICAAFQSLTDTERRDVLSHLQNMVSDNGWHAEQVMSALAALEAIRTHYPVQDD